VSLVGRKDENTVSAMMLSVSSPTRSPIAIWHAVPAFVAVHPVRERGKGIGDRFKAQYVAAVAI